MFHVLSIRLNLDLIKILYNMWNTVCHQDLEEFYLHVTVCDCFPGVEDLHRDTHPLSRVSRTLVCTLVPKKIVRNFVTLP